MLLMRRVRSPGKGKVVRLMGETRAEVTVKRDTSSKQPVRVRCIVDTGADYTVLPRTLLERLGVKPHRREQFELANGTRIERDLGRVFVQFQDRAEYSPVIFGEPGDSTLLGVLTLENLGLGVDPLRRTLYPLSLRMQSMLR